MMHRKVYRLLSSFFALFFLVSSFPAGAEDDLLIVPRDAGVFQFSGAELLANDTGVDSPDVLLLTQPTRGELVELGDETFEYLPGPDFGSLGMDVFRYRYRADGELRSAGVYLFPDLRQSLLLREPVDDGTLNPFWEEIDPDDLLTPILENPITADWAIEVGYRTATAAYLEIDWSFHTGTSAGGNLELDIDPGGGNRLLIPVGVELRLVSGLGRSSTVSSSFCSATPRTITIWSPVAGGGHQPAHRWSKPNPWRFRRGLIASRSPGGPRPATELGTAVCSWR